MAFYSLVNFAWHFYSVFLILGIVLDGVIALYNEKSEPDRYIASLNISVCKLQRKYICISHGEKEAFYGSSSSHEKVEGFITHVRTNGCDKFRFPVHRNPWIALIQRGSCFFTSKIRNAMNHNASGVIIYGDEPGSSFTMFHHNPGFVAVSITYELGKDIMSQMNNSDVFVAISFKQTIKGREKKAISVLFVSVSFIVLMIISLAWLVFYYIQRFRFLYARDRSERQMTTAAKKAIAKLTSRTINKKDDHDNSCAVCLEEYKSGETIRTLPCHHEFHKHCVDPWLIEHRTCPMCKKNILKELGMLHSEDEQVLTQENDVTVSITPNDHNSGFNNSGLLDEDGIARTEFNQAVSCTSGACLPEVTPVETTTSNCEFSYVRTEKPAISLGPAAV